MTSEVKLTEKEFREGFPPMSRSRIRSWKKEYYKKNFRPLKPLGFYESITTMFQKLKK